MKKCENYYFRNCSGCGKTEHEVRTLTAMANRVFICEDCVLICVSILCTQTKENTRIYFVDEINSILEEPTQVVAKWKEIRARNAETNNDSKDEQSK